jgi:hypothetical protein
MKCKVLQQWRLESPGSSKQQKSSHQVVDERKQQWAAWTFCQVCSAVFVLRELLGKDRLSVA